MLGHLPERLHASVGKALRDAWDLESADRAARVLKRLAGSLERDHPGAAASIREGLEEIRTWASRRDEDQPALLVHREGRPGVGVPLAGGVCALPACEARHARQPLGDRQPASAQRSLRGRPFPGRRRARSRRVESKVRAQYIKLFQLRTTGRITPLTADDPVYVPLREC